MELKVAAFRELRPFVAMTPAGLSRTIFEERVAARLGVELPDVQRELAAPAREPGRAHARAAAPAPAGRPGRVKVLLASPAVDALGLLALWPADLGPAAEDENLLGVLPAGPVSEVARGLLAGDLDCPQALSRLEGALDAASLARVRQLAGPAAPRKERAERELRRSVVKAKIEAREQEHERLSAAVARAGSPAPEELVKEQLELAARLRDLRKRLAGLERP